MKRGRAVDERMAFAEPSRRAKRAVGNKRLTAPIEQELSAVADLKQETTMETTPVEPGDDGPEGPDDFEKSLRRLGPLERAIRLNQGVSWLEEARSRCRIVLTEHGECWVWKGARRQNGYGSTGRLGTQRLVHRVSAWSTIDFRGDLRALPEVHHTCAIKLCINPAHLAFATSMTNSLEQSVRHAIQKRLNALRNALSELAPDHPLLHPAFDSDPMILTRAAYSERSESDRWRTRRMLRTAEWDARRQANEHRRFRQVLEVEKLTKQGMTQVDALRQIGMSRTTFDGWRQRLRARLAGESGYQSDE